MTEFQTALTKRGPFVTDGTNYAKSVLQRRRDRTVADIFRRHRDDLSRQPDGCMIRIFPTEYTYELKRYSEEDYHVRRCIDTLFKDGLNPTEMFLKGLTRQFSDHSEWEEDEDRGDAELREIDALRDDFEATLVPHLDRCIEQATFNIIRYGFTPIGYKTISGRERTVPYVPSEFVIVRFQPCGEYLCQGIDGDIDQGPFELFFFHHLSDEERPISDLTTLLPLYRKLQRAREVHDRSLIHASRPYIVTSHVLESRDSEDPFEDERRERHRAKLRERMLREQVNRGTSAAMRYVDMAAAVGGDRGVGALGRAEELCGNGFVASAMRRTHQEMADKLYTLKTRHHQEKQKLKDKVRVLEDFLERYAAGQTSSSVDLPTRYELPEGSSHVGSHLNVRPNALSYESLERLYHVQVETCILSKQTCGRASKADTRQGVTRSLVAEVDNGEADTTSSKSVILQRFFIHVVLAKWLAREDIPMAPTDPIQQSLRLAHFHLMDRILRKGRMKLWLMCNTGYRATDISMSYRQNDPYRTGQAIVVPQAVVPIASSRGVPNTTEEEEDEDAGSQESLYNDDDDDTRDGRKRARR